MKKLILFILVLLVVFLFTGCRVHLVSPTLSFDSYEYTKEEVEEEETTEYDYTFTLGIKVDGSLDGKYYIEICNSDDVIVNHGPVNITGTVIPVNINFTTAVNYREITIKLYKGKDNLQETIEQIF